MKNRTALVFLALVALLLVACGESDPKTIDSVDGMCSYYGTMVESDLEDQAIRDFLAAGISYGTRTDAPGFVTSVKGFAKALDEGDGETQSAFHDSISFFCEDYWARHGLPDGIDWKGPEVLVEELTRGELEAAITQRLDELIQERDLPYEPWGESSLDDQDKPTETPEATLPAGTYLSMPLQQPDAATGIEGVVYDPLDLYAETVRPYFDQLEAIPVVMYWLPWNDTHQNVFMIYPEDMKRFLDGELTAKQLADEMLIYGL